MRVHDRHSGQEERAMAWYHDYITCTPGVQGGEPCVKGTRTPVRSVAVLHHQIYHYDRAKVQAALPHLSAKQMEAALAYYQDNRAEIDTLIREQREALQELAAAR